MNYIILDLEWDSAYSVYHKRFINQILQIGAVKLDEDLKIIDSFEATICSAISRRVTGRFASITGITSEKMRQGIPLADAVMRYNLWAGNNTVTMSWSTSDLFTIFENEKLLLKNVRFNIEKYLDLQRYVQNEMRLLGEESTNQISLLNAAEYFSVSTVDFDLHTAKDDSTVCAVLLKKTYNQERFEELINDTKNPEFYNKLFFKPYYINSLSNELVDKSKLKFTCKECARHMKRLTKWHYRNRWFSADFICTKCKKVYSCRVCFRKNYDDVTVKRRILEAKKEDKNEMQPVSEKVQ